MSAARPGLHGRACLDTGVGWASPDRRRVESTRA